MRLGKFVLLCVSLLALATYFLFAAPASAWVSGTRHGTTTVYDGLVATRGSAPSGQRAETQAMARCASFTRSAATKIKIITPNWFGAENVPGATATVTASIEYPAGTFTQLKWSSATSATISNGGQVTSDYATLAVPIPINTQYWIREYIINASGVVVDAFQGQQLSLGDALIVGNSGVADQTLSGTVTDGNTFESICPLAIIAPITAPSVCILGDSIALGVDNDHTPNSAGDNGAIAPSIGPSFGYSNMGVNGDSASAFVSNHTNRGAVLPYCTTVDVEFGTNDLELLGNSVAQLQANLTTIYGLAAAGSTVFQNTLIPRTDSSNVPVASESKRVAFNTALRSASFGPNGGYFDPEPIVGTSTNNSIWKTSPSFPACNPWTDDHVHPNTCSYYGPIQSSGYIDLSRIHYPFLLKRDIDPASNDNDPMWLEKAA